MLTKLYEKIFKGKVTITATEVYELKELQGLIINHEQEKAEFELRMTLEEASLRILCPGYAKFLRERGKNEKK